jgi:hypothetical protein
LPEEAIDSWVDAIRPTTETNQDAMILRPDPAASTAEHREARENFSRHLRGDYADELYVPPRGQVHHAIELQVINRYPGVYSGEELNEPWNMRGIPRELTGEELARSIEAQSSEHGPVDPATYIDPNPTSTRMQLHNVAIRDAWDQKYAELDAKLAEEGLKPGDPRYAEVVRANLESAVEEMDWRYGQFFSESRHDQDWTQLAPEARPVDWTGAPEAADTSLEPGQPDALLGDPYDSDHGPDDLP